MNWDWDSLKDHARFCYEKVSAFFLFQTLVGYLVACLVSERPLGIAGYVAFLNHCCQWRGV